MKRRFRVEWREETDSRTVWLFGEIDLASVPALQEALECEQPRLEVDLSNVTFMDLSGLTCLLDAAKSHTVALVATTPRVDRLLELTDSNSMFDPS